MLKPLTALALTILLTGGLGAQTTVNLTPVADNSIYSEAADNNNGAGIHLFWGSTSTGNLRRALLQFDVSAIPSDATITAVSLVVNVNQAPPLAPSGAVTLHRASTAWGEGTTDAAGAEGNGGAAATPGSATWNEAEAGSTPWINAGGDFTSAASATVTVGASAPAVVTWTSAGLIADVQDMVANPAANHGWFIIGNEEVPKSARRASSSENSTTANRPRLSVTYTLPPVPPEADAWLLE